MIASMVIMMNHVHMAAPTLTKEIPIESKKIAGIVKPLIRKKSTVAGSWCSASSRSFLVEYKCIAFKSSLPNARVTA
jgi:hypothetical protein